VRSGVEVVDPLPFAWRDYFADLATNCTGWDGDKYHASMDGNLLVAANCDAAGHVQLSLTLHGPDFEPDWTVEVCIPIVAGNLDALAKDARAFFDPQQRA
jgi:hypothetical protein